MSALASATFTCGCLKLQNGGHGPLIPQQMGNPEVVYSFKSTIGINWIHSSGSCRCIWYIAQPQIVRIPRFSFVCFFNYLYLSALSIFVMPMLYSALEPVICPLNSAPSPLSQQSHRHTNCSGIPLFPVCYLSYYSRYVFWWLVKSLNTYRDPGGSKRATAGC